MIGDLAGGDLLPGRVLLCGGGADLPQVRSVLDEDGWWQRLPFARRPKVRALAPDEVIGLRDATGSLGTRQDVTPMALAHQALILDAGSHRRRSRHAQRPCARCGCERVAGRRLPRGRRRDHDASSGACARPMPSA